MKILSIDSSGLVATVALVVDEILVGEYTIHNKKTHSQTLLPMISDMMSMAEVEPEELDGIAVSEGPGSFTGLRIGASTAKGLAWTLGIPIIPVPSLLGLAQNVDEEGALVCPIMDARRNQAYYAVYRIEGDMPKMVLEPDVATIDVVIDKVNSLDERVVFLGDGVPVFQDKIQNDCTVQTDFVRSSRRYQCGASVAEVGCKLYEQGKYVTAAAFAPVYLRKSQAEREREQKIHK